MSTVTFAGWGAIKDASKVSFKFIDVILSSLYSFVNSKLSPVNLIATSVMSV